MTKTNWLTKVILFAGIVVALLSLDLIVKEVVYTTLRGQPDIVFIPGFWSFHYTANPDIGFSLLSFLDKILSPIVKRVLIVCLQFVGVGVAAFFFFSPKDYLRSWVKRLPLALIAAGGLGNAIDRIIRGFVVDYVYWHAGSFSWPIFNLADTYTVLGVILLGVMILFTKEEKKPAALPTDPGKTETPPSP